MDASSDTSSDISSGNSRNSDDDDAFHIITEH